MSALLFILQEYNYHLGAVNTVTFIDDNRRFVSSSDDKSLRVWEFGIPVQIKYIADPSMHSMPAVTPNPAGTAILCQSLDNQVCRVYVLVMLLGLLLECLLVVAKTGSSPCGWDVSIRADQ